MEFDVNRPIYLQICDSLSESILTGEIKPDERILSVREYAAQIGVNPNTVARSYEALTSDGIIYNKRGIGYFVSAVAPQKVLESARQSFYENELPQFVKRMRLLNISFEDIMK